MNTSFRSFITITSFISIVVIILLSSCRQDNKFELLGLWEGKIANKNMSRNELKELNNALKGAMELEFLESGKVNMLMAGYKTIGSYKFKEGSLFITADGIEKEFEILNNRIVIDLDGQIVEYSKSRSSKKRFNQNSNEAFNSLISKESKNLYAKWSLVSLQEPDSTKSMFSAIVYGMEKGSTLELNENKTFVKKLLSGKSISGKFINDSKTIEFIQENGLKKKVKILFLDMGVLKIKEFDTGVVKKYERVFD